MINKTTVQKALSKTWAQDCNPSWFPNNPSYGQSSSETSQLIHDIFGGEILKTHKKKGWHFYNRIDGERFDFTSSEMGKAPLQIWFEDIPSSLGETNTYFEMEDYTTLLLRFIDAYEDVVYQGQHAGVVV